MPCLGRAHTLGLSTASFDVGPGGRVDGRFNFASAEPLAGVRLDRDHDGTESAAEVAAARDDLARFVLDGVEVDADGSACAAAFDDAAIDAIDGLTLRVTYRCPDDADALGVTLYYLSALPPGHREVARIAAGSYTAQAVLTGDHRALELRLPPHPRRRIWWHSAAGAAVAALALALLLLRIRPSRLTS
jgi:hypothetical protein